MIFFLNKTHSKEAILIVKHIIILHNMTSNERKYVQWVKINSTFLYPKKETESRMETTPTSALGKVPT